LTPLIAVEKLRLAVTIQCLIETVHTKTYVHRVRQPPR
jgi:ribonucleotide reductase beta subunit family protein with ferritin-like domain